MKKYFTIAALSVGFISFGQTLPNNLRLAITDTITVKALNLDFSYYNKNYRKVFSQYMYTFDTTKYGTGYSFVGDNGRLYENSMPLFQSMPLPGTLPNDYYYYNPECFTRNTLTADTSKIFR